MFPKFRTNLASSQDPADLPYDRFVTADICRSIKHEADVVSQVVPVVVSGQLHRETDNSMVPSWTSHESATKGALRYHWESTINPSKVSGMNKRRTVFRDLIKVEEYSVCSRRSLPGRRGFGSSAQKRLRMLRRREVSRNGDKTFRNLIHNFWALVVIEHGVEHGLNPRKKRIPVGHDLEEVQFTRGQPVRNALIKIPTCSHSRVLPQASPQRRCLPQWPSARSLFLSPSSHWRPYCSADSPSGGRFSHWIPQTSKRRRRNPTGRPMNIDCACETVSSAYDNLKKPSSGASSFPLLQHPRKRRRNAMRRPWSG